MLQLRCPLGHVLEIEAEHFGQRLMCPLCQAVVHAVAPRQGNPPTAKYEVQCAKGHILRVKQKYLGKEVRCPSCQELVSMKAKYLLTSDGTRLSVARPEAFKKKSTSTDKVPAQQAKKTGPLASATVKNTSLTPRFSSSRIPPPPQIDDGSDIKNQSPLPPELVSDDSFDVRQQLAAASSPAPASGGEDDFEFEVVDTQFHMELEASGMEAPKAPPVKKEPRTKRPSSHLEPPPVRRAPPTSLSPPPPAQLAQPTGLHSLSTSEMMKVQSAALDEAIGAVKAQFECPQGHLLEVEEQYRGMHIQCPLCNIVFELPAT